MAKSQGFNTVDEMAKFLCNSTKEILETVTGSSIAFSPTVQKIPTTYMRPDIGCFVQFNGDFSGIVIMNFTAGAAVEIYRAYMSSIGVFEQELATSHTNDEVRDSVGELVNQIIGKLRREIENKFGVVVYHNQPKVVTISKSIALSIATEIARPQSRRISFRTQNNNPFYVEFSMEQTEFIPLFPVDHEGELDPDKLLMSMGNCK